MMLGLLVSAFAALIAALWSVANGHTDSENVIGEGMEVRKWMMRKGVEVHEVHEVSEGEIVWWGWGVFELMSDDIEPSESL